MLNRLNKRLVMTVLLWSTVAGCSTAFAQQYEVKKVSVLQHLNARYQTMKLISAGEIWSVKAGSAISREVVVVPKQDENAWVEALLLIKNTRTKDMTFEYKTAKLTLADGRAVQPWEYLVNGMGDYDDVVRSLQLSDKPPTEGLIHFKLAGTFYCNIKNGQQTWMIFIFGVPKSTKEAKLVINDKSSIEVKIPVPK